MGIVNKAVQDGIGASRIADHAAPMIDGKLACHNRRASQRTNRTEASRTGAYPRGIIPESCAA
jgi:hypothetical protein